MTSTKNLPKTTNSVTNELCEREFGWTIGQYETIKRMYFKGLDDNEIAVFGYICKRTGLDPIMKQIYAIPRNTKQPDGSYKKVITAQTSIDGYRLIADRTGKYSPGRDSVHNYITDSEGNNKLYSSTSYIKKLTDDGSWHEVSATAVFNEYNGNTDFWRTKPHIMLDKCAEALALRKAFPAQLSGVYTKEEMDQADNAKLPEAQYEEVTPEVTPIQKISEEQLSQILEMIKLVDDTCIVNMCKFLKEKHNIEEYADMTINAYESCMRALRCNIEKKQKESVAA